MEAKDRLGGAVGWWAGSEERLQVLLAGLCEAVGRYGLL